MNKERIKKNIEEVLSEIKKAAEKAGQSSDNITLITVTKTHPAEILQAVIDSGCKNIGENKVQEITAKVPLLTGEKIVHLIGHLQSNKVNKAVPLVDWIHSLDSKKIIDKVNNTAQRLNKKINCLIQVNTSFEESKSGCAPEIAEELCAYASEKEYINFRGLMTIGPLTTDEKTIRKSFSLLRDIGDKCKKYCSDKFELSMGMSYDFAIAIEEGATMVRVGSRILGARDYSK